ncbi:hypothetical protein G7Y89_g15756 [Cudoniella acicularis]|uniref:Uncharacterized protein n=1 Tax=Cudoniella acicularis TaxID=354080 RepID=A0A8H4VJN8_9HELO|nr:hypothetical protein G7Y89_g15756 [Cudoniella acicularis]
MAGTAGGMGMMQNNGMAHMGASGSHVPTYQTPYSSSPYGASIPTSSPSNLLPNFMPATSNPPSFPMNSSNMNPQQQHQAQRMQPPPNTSTPTQNAAARASPFGGVPHSTPPNPASAPVQLSTPQAQNQTHLQTPNNAQQSQATILTPQTPNFPPGSQTANAGSSIASPLSPGSEIREKERVSLLLDINRELLMEVMRLQAAQAETKEKESKDNATASDGSPQDKLEKEKAEKQKAASSREYVECMRRLQSNLAYLAAIADRSHKPSSQIPAHPAIMTAPPLTPKPSNPTTSSSPKAEPKKEETEEKKPEEAEEDRLEILKDQYKRLQELFPGVDPKKEPTMQAPNPAARTQAQQQAAQQPQKQPGQGLDQNQQQKLQNDLLRQKMMQAQQAQNAQMAQGMQGAVFEFYLDSKQARVGVLLLSSLAGFGGVRHSAVCMMDYDYGAGAAYGVEGEDGA